MSVTAANRAEMETIKSRNGVLARLEAQVAGHPVTADGCTASEATPTRHAWRSETRRRAHVAHRDGRTCGKCGRDLADVEPIWQVRLGIGYTITGSFGYWQAPVCEGCAGPLARLPYRYTPPSPCHGCGRGVAYRLPSRPRRWVLCSERCAWTARNRRRSDRLAMSRAKRCAACEREFMAPRSDAVTCSAACRQKAYRRRKGEAA